MQATPTADTIGEFMHVTAGIRRLVRRRIAESVPLTPLPEAQRELMLVVQAQPGIRIAAAARELALAGNSVSTLVNTLVDAGLLRREVDPEDRRAARLFLTPAASDRLRLWRRARTRLLGAALERVGPDDRRAIEAALPALHRLLAQLRETP